MFLLDLSVSILNSHSLVCCLHLLLLLVTNHDLAIILSLELWFLIDGFSQLCDDVRATLGLGLRALLLQLLLLLIVRELDFDDLIVDEKLLLVHWLRWLALDCHHALVATRGSSNLMAMLVSCRGV